MYVKLIINHTELVVIIENVFTSFFCVTAHAKKLTWQKQNNFQIWISNFMYVNRKNAMISYH